MDTTHPIPPLLLNDGDLADLRGGCDRDNGFRQLHHRCLVYVLGYRHYRRRLSVEDAEEIVSQAVVEEFHSISDPGMGVDEVSLLLRRALNRVRARYARHSGKQSSLAFEQPPSEDLTAAMELREEARSRRQVIRQAIEALSDRDRNLLIDRYGLEGCGFAKRGASPKFASASSHKVALWRARRRLFDEICRLMEPGVAGANSSELRGIRSLIESRSASWQSIPPQPCNPQSSSLQPRGHEATQVR